MRPRSFWSAFLIYGAALVVAFLAFFLVLVGLARARPEFADVLLVLGIFVPVGLLLGLVMAFGLGPTRRTFAYENPERFRARFEESLHSLHYRLHSESPSRLTYRRPINIFQPLAWFADIVVEMGSDSAQVSGPREFLNRAERKLRDAKM